MTSGTKAAGPVVAVALLNLLAAVVAFAKDMGMAAYLGIGPEADAFYLAFFVPDAVGSNLLSSALTLATVVVFTTIGRERRWLRPAVVEVTRGCLAFSILVGLILWVFRPIILARLGTGALPTVLGWAQNLYPLLLPVVVFLPLTAILSGLLQARRHFAWAALLPVITNTIWTVVVLLCQVMAVPLATGIRTAAVGVAGAAAITYLVAWLLASRLPYDEGFRIASPHPTRDWWAVAAQTVPLILVNLSSQMVLFGERSLASTAGDGVVAALNYAFRFAQLPLWTFVLALNTVFLPQLAEGSALEHLQPLVERMLRLVALVTISASLVLWFLRVPIISIVLRRGSFDQRSLALTADLLGSYTLTIIPMGLVSSCQRLLAARQGLAPVLIGGIAGATLTLSLDLSLLRRLGPVGLGYGSAAGAWLNLLVVLLVLTRNKMVILPTQLVQWSRSLVGHLPLAATLAGCNCLWTVLEPLSRIRIFAWVGLAAPATVVAWLACLKWSGDFGWVMSLSELHNLRAMLTKEGDEQHV